MIRTRLQGDTPFFPNMLNNGKVEVCLKEDVDKVIADLEESHKMEVEQLLIEIVEHKNKLQNVSDLLKETREWLVESQKLHKRCADNAVKVIKHQKYKRCLEMAERCKDKIENAVQYNEHDDWLIINEFWERWQERWLNISEKFKHNSTAQ